MTKPKVWITAHTETRNRLTINPLSIVYLIQARPRFNVILLAHEVVQAIVNVSDVDGVLVTGSFDRSAEGIGGFVDRDTGAVNEDGSWKSLLEMTVFEAFLTSIKSTAD